MSASAAWKQWVKHGDSALETSRRRVFGASIRSPAEQRREATGDDLMVLQEIHGFFNSNAHEFEGLASWVAGRVLGPASSRGWVTPRVDGGIDFVSRLDLGSGFSKTTVVVLGQAKCIAPDSSVSGIDSGAPQEGMDRGCRHDRDILSQGTAGTAGRPVSIGTDRRLPRSSGSTRRDGSNRHGSGRHPPS